MKKHILSLLGIVLITAASGVGDSIQTDTTLEVDSGIFASVHYNTRRSILTLTFRNGAAYDYYQVSRKTYETFLRTRYKGSFFHAHINFVNFVIIILNN